MNNSDSIELLQIRRGFHKRKKAIPIKMCGPKRSRNISHVEEMPTTISCTGLGCDFTISVSGSLWTYALSLTDKAPDVAGLAAVSWIEIDWFGYSTSQRLIHQKFSAAGMHVNQLPSLRVRTFVFREYRVRRRRIGNGLLD